MNAVKSIVDELEKIDLEIIRLLEERRDLVQNAQGDEEEEAEDAGETIALWMDEAAGRDLDESIMGKLVRLVLGLCRKGEE